MTEIDPILTLLMKFKKNNKLKQKYINIENIFFFN